jgi:hypothetical protein
LAYILASNKKEQSYKVIFEKIKELTGHSPSNIITDFELAFMKILKLVYPNAHQTGCLFHFGQCIWRKIQSLGLSVMYNSDSKFKYAIRLFLNLAFVDSLNVYKEYKKN